MASSLPTDPERFSPHPASLAPKTLLGGCKVRRLRRSGPGGQHRNKVETAVQLCHLETGVSAEANERRSQSENQKVALKRLRLNLALEVRLLRPLPLVPSPLWKSRSHSGRLSISASSDDFPELLAEALDVIAACDWNVGPAAETLGATNSQLVKLLKKEPRALALVNHQRAVRGLGMLE